MRYPNPRFRNPFVELVKGWDYYGQPIAMNDENRESHQTVFGGIITITVFTLFFGYFLISMYRSDKFYLKDTVSTTMYRYGYEDPQPAAALSDGKYQNFMLKFYVDDPTFDNNDNPYGTFKMHMYTNMESPEDIETTGNGQGNFKDIEVPIKECMG